MTALMEPNATVEDAESQLKKAGREVLELSVLHKLYRVADKSTKAKSEFIKSQVGLSMDEWKVLLLIGSFEPLSTKEVSQRSTLDKTKVSRTTLALTNAGLVSMDRDKGDRRKLELKLTNCGRDKFRKVVECLRVWDAKLMEAVGSAAQGDLVEALTRLDHQLDGMRRKHDELAKRL